MLKLLTLKVLCVANCKALKSLPLDIEHFPALETLLVDNCDMLQLSEEHLSYQFLLCKKMVLKENDVQEGTPSPSIIQPCIERLKSKNQ